MYSKILVPLDGSTLSEQVLSYARVIADAYRAPIELLRIVDPGRTDAVLAPQSDDRYLEEIAAKHFRSSIPVTTRVKIGKPAEVIVDHAKGDPACLIAMATHGLSGPRRWRSAVSPAKSSKAPPIRCC